MLFCVFCLWVFASSRLPGWHLESDGSLDYVSVPASLTFVNVNALVNLIHTFLRHAIERGERPGESQEALDRKKKPDILAVARYNQIPGRRD